MITCELSLRESMSDKSHDALKAVEMAEIEAKEFGFYWEHIEQLTDQIQSECQEILEAWQKNSKEHIEEEIGDLLLAAASLAVFCQVDPHTALTQSCDKFKKRYTNLVALAKKDGHSNLKNQSFETLLYYWKLAKNSC